MKYLKKFQQILENEDISSTSQYSIYDWFEDLKRFQWNNEQINPVNEISLKKYSDIFIGKGYFENIQNRISKINNSLEKVDIDYIKDRLSDLFDEYMGKKNYVMKSVLYGNYEDYNKKIKYRYNGSLSYNQSKSNNHLLIDILKAIIHPTLYIGYPSVNLRINDNERYVRDEKYQCCNFDISKYHVYDMVLNKSVTRISKFDLGKKTKYNIQHIIDMYQPGIYVSIGGELNDFNVKMNLKKIEAEIDNILPSILHDIDYQEVIFDNTRGDRMYDDNIEISDYTFKILLKL